MPELIELLNDEESSVRLASLACIVEALDPEDAGILYHNCFNLSHLNISTIQ